MSAGGSHDAVLQALETAGGGGLDAAQWKAVGEAVRAYCSETNAGDGEANQSVGKALEAFLDAGPEPGGAEGAVVKAELVLICKVLMCADGAEIGGATVAWREAELGVAKNALKRKMQAMAFAQVATANVGEAKVTVEVAKVGVAEAELGVAEAVCNAADAAAQGEARVGVAEAKVGVAEAKVGVAEAVCNAADAAARAEAKVGVAEAKVGVAEANLGVAEAVYNAADAAAGAGAKAAVAKAKMSVAEAKVGVAEAVYNAADAATRDEAKVAVEVAKVGEAEANLGVAEAVYNAADAAAGGGAKAAVAKAKMSVAEAKVGVAEAMMEAARTVSDGYDASLRNAKARHALCALQNDTAAAGKWAAEINKLTADRNAFGAAQAGPSAPAHPSTPVMGWNTPLTADDQSSDHVYTSQSSEFLCRADPAFAHFVRAMANPPSVLPAALGMLSKAVSAVPDGSLASFGLLAPSARTVHLEATHHAVLQILYDDTVPRDSLYASIEVPGLIDVVKRYGGRLCIPPNDTTTGIAGDAGFDLTANEQARTARFRDDSLAATYDPEITNVADDVDRSIHHPSHETKTAATSRAARYGHSSAPTPERNRTAHSNIAIVSYCGHELPLYLNNRCDFGMGCLINNVPYLFCIAEPGNAPKAKQVAVHLHNLAFHYLGIPNRLSFVALSGPFVAATNVPSPSNPLTLDLHGAYYDNAEDIVHVIPLRTFECTTVDEYLAVHASFRIAANNHTKRMLLRLADPRFRDVAIKPHRVWRTPDLHLADNGKPPMSVVKYLPHAAAAIEKEYWDMLNGSDFGAAEVYRVSSNTSAVFLPFISDVLDDGGQLTGAHLVSLLNTVNGLTFCHGDIRPANIRFHTDPAGNARAVLIDFELVAEYYPPKFNVKYPCRHPGAKGRKAVLRQHDLYAALSIVALCTPESGPNSAWTELFTSMLDELRSSDWPADGNIELPDALADFASVAFIPYFE